MKSYRVKILFLLLLLSWVGGETMAGNYPARCRVKTNLNVRSKPSKNTPRLGLLTKGDTITVEYTTGESSNLWGAVNFRNKRGYIAMRYVQGISSVDNASITTSGSESRYATFFFGKLWIWARWIILGLAIVFGIRLFIRWVVNIDNINSERISPKLFLSLYYFFSFPIYWLNQLEHFLAEPWRYLFRTDWIPDKMKPALRVVLEVMSVAMYMAITPLRLFNAIIYNIMIHCVTGVYDLLIEVFMPCDSREGAGSVGRWILLFPWRVLKYLAFHGLLTVIESVLWTVADVFIPARTLYHGTDLNACEAIIGDPYRNKHLKKTSDWTTGTFLASTSPNCSWAGRGVYFAINRKLASGYSDLAGECGRDPVMIACRVSMGRVVNYTLSPSRIYRQAGYGGNHNELNIFGDQHGYTTGEWYNNRHHWEYCLFDWQNRYNHPWRIRPIYVLNFRTGRAQHIKGGVQHWLFDKAVLTDIGILGGRK